MVGPVVRKLHNHLKCPDVGYVKSVINLHDIKESVMTLENLEVKPTARIHF